MPGTARFTGTPQAANAHYEDAVMPLLFEKGGYPAVAGRASARDLFGHDAAVAGFDRVLVVRYPSRRAFFELVTDPRYLPLAPYKLMAQDVVLVPVDAEIALPDVRVALGVALALAFLAIGWRRAAG